jgi:hypothetical protein
VPGVNGAEGEEEDKGVTARERLKAVQSKRAGVTNRNRIGRRGFFYSLVRRQGACFALLAPLNTVGFSAH